MKYEMERSDLMITTVHRAYCYRNFKVSAYRNRVTKIMVGAGPDFQIYYSQWVHVSISPRIDLMPTVDL